MQNIKPNPSNSLASATFSFGPISYTTFSLTYFSAIEASLAMLLLATLLLLLLVFVTGRSAFLIAPGTFEDFLLRPLPVAFEACRIVICRKRSCTAPLGWLRRVANNMIAVCALVQHGKQAEAAFRNNTGACHWIYRVRAGKAAQTDSTTNDSIIRITCSIIVQDLKTVQVANVIKGQNLGKYHL